MIINWQFFSWLLCLACPSGSALPAAAAPAEPPGTLPGALASLAGARVLVVEDNEINQEVARELLEQAGFVVDIAEDGAVALARVRATRYNIVFMDLQMPVMDGLTATREIRKLPACAGLPIVAITANAMADDRERCLAAGMNDHLAKPIDPNALWLAVLRWVKPPATAAAPGPAPLPAGPEAPVAPGLPEIPGLDMASGLRYALGRASLYRSLLEKFASSQHDFPAHLATALASRDWPTAKRQAHSLKGVAGQIGALTLANQAAQLEQALQQTPAAAASADLGELPATITSALNTLIAAIAAHYPGAVAGAGQAAPAGSFAEPDVTAICAALERALAANDVNAGRLLSANAAVLHAALGADYGWIAEAIEQFNFAAALDWLREARARPGNSGTA